MAVYYGSSASEVTTITNQSNVDYIVLNLNAGPFNSSGNVVDNVASMVSADQANYVRVLGYVDSGASNRALSATCSTTVSGSGCFAGVSKAPSLCLTNPSGGVWNHWAWDSSRVC